MENRDVETSLYDASLQNYEHNWKANLKKYIQQY